MNKWSPIHLVKAYTKPQYVEQDGQWCKYGGKKWSNATKTPEMLGNFRQTEIFPNSKGHRLFWFLVVEGVSGDPHRRRGLSPGGAHADVTL